MASFRLSNEAKEDLIRIHQYGIRTYGDAQADIYFEAFFDCFAQISQRPFSFEAVDYIRKGYRRCVCGSDSVFFRLKNDVVEIMAIIGRQDLDAIL